MINNSTICAISTAGGTGGIAVIRISGPETFSICDKLYTPVKKGKGLSEQKPYALSFGHIKKNDEIIDDVLITTFHAPHSFTGEDTVEISCHGSMYIQQQIMQLLIQYGATSALPGEFTQRAFLNGKMDLSQAEAVADLIASTSLTSHRLAMSQMRGNFSHELQEVRSQLLDFVSLIELELDFNEEDVEFADRSKLKILANDIAIKIKKLTDSFSVGNAIKNGIPVAIIGETNAGKSTLLNLLLQEEKAIVSEIHGTTRDVIEDTINIQGITFRFIDTAGIRETQDAIETIGIERTFQKIKQASIVIWMIDSTQFSEKIEKITERIIDETKGKKLILAFNKIDKINKEEQNILEQFFSGIEARHIYISAKYKKNIEMLEKILLDTAQIPSISQNDVMVTNVRHYEALIKTYDSIQRVIDGLNTGISGDFLSQDVRECMHYLGEITGQISTDEILGNIFSKFCIGK